MFSSTIEQFALWMNLVLHVCDIIFKILQKTKTETKFHLLVIHRFALLIVSTSSATFRFQHNFSKTFLYHCIMFYESMDNSEIFFLSTKKKRHVINKFFLPYFLYLIL